MWEAILVLRLEKKEHPNLGITLICVLAIFCLAYLTGCFGNSDIPVEYILLRTEYDDDWTEYDTRLATRDNHLIISRSDKDVTRQYYVKFAPSTFEYLQIQLNYDFTKLSTQIGGSVVTINKKETVIFYYKMTREIFRVTEGKNMPQTTAKEYPQEAWVIKDPDGNIIEDTRGGIITPTESPIPPSPTPVPSTSSSTSATTATSSSSSSKTTQETTISQNTTAPTERDFIFPDSETRRLTHEDLKDLPKWDLWIARNEIYARHGRQFSNKELQEYFNSKSWYTASLQPDKNPSLTQLEMDNVMMIKKYE
jgi:hypothetical protein